MNEWFQILSFFFGMFIIFFGNFGMIWWFRKESREDWIRAQNTIDAIRSEMSDFHERLLDIQSRRR